MLILMVIAIVVKIARGLAQNFERDHLPEEVSLRDRVEVVKVVGRLSHGLERSIGEGQAHAFVLLGEEIWKERRRGRRHHEVVTQDRPMQLVASTVTHVTALVGEGFVYGRRVI